MLKKYGVNTVHFVVGFIIVISNCIGIVSSSSSLSFVDEVEIFVSSEWVSEYSQAISACLAWVETGAHLPMSLCDPVCHVMLCASEMSYPVKANGLTYLLLCTFIWVLTVCLSVCVRHAKLMNYSFRSVPDMWYLVM